MDDATRRENEQYEDDVRRVARALWPRAEFAGARVIDGRETDGVFETEDCIHFVEATTSRRREKARQDIEKIIRALDKVRGKSEYRAVRGWFVTRDEPTVDQRRIGDAHRDRINTLSFSQFQARLIDSNAYLDLRNNYPFGIVKDPNTGDLEPAVKYIPLDLVKLGTLDVVPRADLLAMLFDGRTIILLGDFGAGKSMTLREIYRNLRRLRLKGETSKFPVYLNLRDHYGQDDPAEVLERHGRSIGFPQPSCLVRAWRAGYVHLLIDGFDEISALNIQGLWRRLQDNRFRAMEAVRRLIRDHPSEAGLMVAGRAHFFDSSVERHTALGLPRDSVELSLNDLTDDQIATYLRQAGLSGFVPSWLPSRPLLVGYLAAKGLLGVLFGADSAPHQMDRAVGWHNLIDLVASREAEIEAGIDGHTVRRILERLATKARASQGGLGSLSPDAIVRSFSDVCGYSPDERGMVLLQRLPGLGIDRAEEDSRTFIDQAFADACRAGDLVAYVANPFEFDQSVLADMTSAMGSLGIEVAAYRSKQNSFLEGKINAALSAARRSDDSYVATDLTRLILDSGFNIRDEIIIDGVLIPNLELGATKSDLSKLQFRDCYFSRIELDPTIDSSRLPLFRECFIDEFEGRLSYEDLPKGKFDEKCIIESFTATAETTATVLTLDLPLGVRVCLTVLKKLYEQRGSGRRENALHRGLDSHARRLVPSVLRVLQAEGLAIPDRSKEAVIWRPDRSSRKRVGRMIAAPAAENDQVLKKCEVL